MKRSWFSSIILLLAAKLGLAATVWSGPPISVDSRTQPDMLTAHVWIARGAYLGIYNAKTETSFTHYLSPADTEWADGSATNYANLSFTDWNDWTKTIHNGPPNTIGIPAVVHLISEDIYLDITFTGWSVGGYYAYVRTTPASGPNQTPTVTITNPVTGTVLAAPATLNLAARAVDADGTVTNVQFLNGPVSLGNFSTPPYQASVSLPAGTNTLAAIATDNLGATATNWITVYVVNPVTVGLGSVSRTTSGNFNFLYNANPGLVYTVQRTTNLATSAWQILATNQATASPVSFTDSNPPVAGAYYRVGRQPNP